MAKESQKVQQHYARPALYESIVERLKQQGKPLDKISRQDISGVDEFHVRGAEVSRELAQEIPMKGKLVLDVGCGIGGPARMLATEFNCQVIGIDLNHDFIDAALKLTKLLKLEDKVSFQQANALELPFADHSFDLVWTQHVQMNIEDKETFYEEIHRVLKPGGTFIYYDILSAKQNAPTYPLPWADTPDISFLIDSDTLAAMLKKLGFTNAGLRDQTKAGIHFFKQVFERLRKMGPPPIGLDLLMGADAPHKLGNLLLALEEGKLKLESGLCQARPVSE